MPSPASKATRPNLHNNTNGAAGRARRPFHISKDLTWDKI